MLANLERPCDVQFMRIAQQAGCGVADARTNGRALSPNTVRGMPPKCVKAVATPSRQSAPRSFGNGLTKRRRE